ncbi:segregation and condensation protein A [Thermodesulfobacteriota bacterium]
MDEYKVKLEIFEGPLDLLLHLIRKNEVDIFDIPISVIANQYLEYMDMMKALNINLAADFLVMASTLIHIKSRMLLPVNEGEEEEDPRTEILQPLLEYMRLKELAGDLSEREWLERDVFTRKYPSDFKTEALGAEPLLDVSIFQLIDAFRRIVEQNIPGEPIKFETREWSIKDRMTHIIERLKIKRVLPFQDLFEHDKTLSEFIVTFLALLEIVHLGLVTVFQVDPQSDIQLEAKFEDNEAVDYV